MYTLTDVVIPLSITGGGPPCQNTRFVPGLTSWVGFVHVTPSTENARQRPALAKMGGLVRFGADLLRVLAIGSGRVSFPLLEAFAPHKYHMAILLSASCQ